MTGTFVTYWEKREIHRGLWWENLTDRDYLEDLGVAGRRISESILKIYVMELHGLYSSGLG
jgi:hypothetical protein